VNLRMLRNSVGLGLLMFPSSYGDTVTTFDHLSVNGVLTNMSDGTITLEARYASGLKILMIPMSTVESIEFNSTAFNPGAPPKPYGLGPGNSSTPQPQPPKQPIVRDAIVLRGANGERQPCKVLSIDENIVHCEAASGETDKGKPSQFARRIVLRILVGGGR
jgi:hypothetical protein